MCMRGSFFELKQAKPPPIESVSIVSEWFAFFRIIDGCAIRLIVICYIFVLLFV